MWKQNKKIVLIATWVKIYNLILGGIIAFIELD